MKESKNGCTAQLSSMTQAMKAQRALSAAAIPSWVIQSEASSRRGCAYGLRFPCGHENNVRRILASSGISVKEWTREP